MDAAVTVVSGAMTLAQAAPVVADQVQTHFGWLESIAIDILGWFIKTHPALAPVGAVLMLMGTARSLLKPIMTALHEIVKVTPTQYDDNLLASWENSKGYTALCWVLDFLASVKLPATAADSTTKTETK